MRLLTLGLLLVATSSESYAADSVFYYFPKKTSYTKHKAQPAQQPQNQAEPEQAEMPEPAQPAPRIATVAPPAPAKVQPLVPQEPVVVSAPPAVKPVAPAPAAMTYAQPQPPAQRIEQPLSAPQQPMRAQEAPRQRAVAMAAKPSAPMLDDERSDLRVGVSTGYRIDHFEWSIGPAIDSPPEDVLSELTWSNVQRYQAQVDADYTASSGPVKGLHIAASGYKSLAFDGKNQDSDYLGSDHTFEFSRSNNSADNGYSQGVSGSIGYAFDYGDDKEEGARRIIALIGYARSQQKFVMKDGNQTVSAYGNTTPLGEFAGLHSAYAADWYLPYIGGQWNVINGEHRLSLRGLIYAWGQYRGFGSWNLRNDLAYPKSFSHSANANGYSLSLDYGWMFYPSLELTLSAGLQQLYAERGKDVTHFSDGTSSVTKFQNADYTTQNYSVGLAYSF